MNRLQTIYNNAPIPLQHIFTSASGVLRASRRYGGIYRQHREWLLDYDNWSLDEKLSHHAQSLRDFIKFANCNSPFYRDLFSGLSVADVQRPSDLHVLPVVEKETLRTHIDRVYTVPARKSAQHQTGGTTGKPLVVRYTFEDQMRRMALLDHFKSRYGFENRKMLKATFSGKRIVPQGQKQPTYWRYNLAVKQILYSTFHLSEKNLHHYVEHLNRMKPLALDGYVSSMSEIANFIEQKGIALQFQPLAIFPTAETVSLEQRAILERVFRCKVYDQYASAEGAPLVTGCSHGSLHLELSSGVIENLPNSEDILVTSFHTHGTPIVRYKIGDAMKLDLNGGCSCGVAGPLIESIYGRSADYLLRTDGAKITNIHVTSLLRRLPDVINHAQFQQKKLGELEVLISLSDSTYRQDVEDILERENLHVFGSDTTVRIQYVDNIPRAASGKHQLIKNMMSQEPS